MPSSVSGDGFGAARAGCRADPCPGSAMRHPCRWLGPRGRQPERDGVAGRRAESRPSSRRSALALVVVVADLITDGAAGIGFLGLAPLLTAGAERFRARDRVDDGHRPGDRRSRSGCRTRSSARGVHFGLLAGELFAGLLAVYIARFRKRAQHGAVPRGGPVRRRLHPSAALRARGRRAAAAARDRGAARVRGRRPLGGAPRPHAAMREDLADARASTPRSSRRSRESSSSGRGWACPGKVLASGAAAWFEEVTFDRELPRADPAAEMGLRSAVAFPLRTSGGIVGVIELFSQAVAAGGGRRARPARRGRRPDRRVPRGVALGERPARVRGAQGRHARGGPRHGRDDRPPRARRGAQPRRGGDAGLLARGGRGARDGGADRAARPARRAPQGAEALRGHRRGRAARASGWSCAP